MGLTLRIMLVVSDLRWKSTLLREFPPPSSYFDILHTRFLFQSHSQLLMKRSSHECRFDLLDDA